MICFEHGAEYDGCDVLMCPVCEEEICREHDDTLKENENEST